jgi:hypothetical protein
MKIFETTKQLSLFNIKSDIPMSHAVPNDVLKISTELQGRFRGDFRSFDLRCAIGDGRPTKRGPSQICKAL